MFADIMVPGAFAGSLQADWPCGEQTIAVGGFPMHMLESVQPVCFHLRNNGITDTAASEITVGILYIVQVRLSAVCVGRKMPSRQSCHCIIWALKSSNRLTACVRHCTGCNHVGTKLEGNFRPLRWPIVTVSLRCPKLRVPSELTSAVLHLVVKGVEVIYETALRSIPCGQR